MAKTVLLARSRVKSMITVSPNTQVNQVKAFNRNNKGYATLYDTYHHTSVSQQAYMAAFIARIFVFVIVISCLYTQAALLLVTNLAMLLYITINNPFTSKVDTILGITREFIMTSEAVFVTALAIMESNGSATPSTTNQISMGIIVTIITFVALAIMTLLIQCFRLVKKLFKKSKKSSAKKVNYSAAPTGSTIIPLGPTSGSRRLLGQANAQDLSDASGSPTLERRGLFQNSLRSTMELGNPAEVTGPINRWAKLKGSPTLSPISPQTAVEDELTGLASVNQMSPGLSPARQRGNSMMSKIQAKKFECKE